MLTILVQVSEVGREVHAMMGQVDFSVGRKLPRSQNSELICLHSVPDLVNRSAGLSVPGHQNQLSGEEVERISMSLVP